MYREASYVERCAICDETASRACSRCRLGLCDEHAPRPDQRCTPCEADYDHRLSKLDERRRTLANRVLSGAVSTAGIVGLGAALTAIVVVLSASGTLTTGTLIVLATAVIELAIVAERVTAAAHRRADENLAEHRVKRSRRRFLLEAAPREEDTHNSTDDPRSLRHCSPSWFGRRARFVGASEQFRIILRKLRSAIQPDTTGPTS